VQFLNRRASNTTAIRKETSRDDFKIVTVGERREKERKRKEP